MKSPFRTKLPARPTFPIEARIAELRARDRELLGLITEAEQVSPGVVDDDVSATIDAEAHVLIAFDSRSQKPRKAPANLKALRHERAVVLRAIQIGSDQLGDLRAAWASGELSSRLGDYRQLVKNLAIQIAACQKLERDRQAFLQSFGLASAKATLPCARFGLSVALGERGGPLREFMSAALAAGLVTQKDFENV
jgi:hypothetical protein